MIRNVTLAIVFSLSIMTLSACSAAIKDEKSASSGEELYYSKCSFCHRPFPPEMRSPEEWDDILDEMAPRAGLSAAEKRKVLKFLRRLPEK